MNYEILKKNIYELLFEEGRNLKIHKLYNDSFIIDIDYDGLANKIIDLIKDHNA